MIMATPPAINVIRELTHQLEVEVPARQAWELYGSLRLAELVRENLSSAVSDVQVVEGDGGVGTLVRLSFWPPSAVAGFTEKFTKVDEEERVKETEVVEGGYLEMGFTLYRVRLHIADVIPGTSCVINSTIFYQLAPDSPAHAADLASIDSLAAIAHVAARHLLTNNNQPSIQ